MHKQERHVEGGALLLEEKKHEHEQFDVSLCLPLLWQICRFFNKSTTPCSSHAAPGFTNMKCNLEECHRTLRKYAVFRSHIYNYHSNKLKDAEKPDILNPVIACSTPETSHAVDPTLIGEDEPPGMDGLDSDFAEPISQTTPSICMQQAAAIYRCPKTQKVRRLPQSATEGIMHHIRLCDMHVRCELYTVCLYALCYHCVVK